VGRTLGGVCKSRSLSSSRQLICYLMQNFLGQGSLALHPIQGMKIIPYRRSVVTSFSLFAATTMEIGLEVDETGSGSCSVESFDISGAPSSGPATRELI
jgi:hypothetical protein